MAARKITNAIGASTINVIASVIMPAAMSSAPAAQGNQPHIKRAEQDRQQDAKKSGSKKPIITSMNSSASAVTSTIRTTREMMRELDMGDGLRVKVENGVWPRRIVKGGGHKVQSTEYEVQNLLVSPAP